MNNPWREIYDEPQSVDPFKYGTPIAPLYLDIEPTNFCNFKCKICTGQQQGTRKRGYLDLELFKSICIQAQQMGVKGVRFLRWGEPLMHPNIIEFIRIAKGHNLLVHMTTNGSLLDHKIGLRLIDSGLDSIIISFQGTSRGENQKLRDKAHHDEVVNNVIDFVSVRNMSKAQNPYVIISTTVTDETDEDQEKFRYTWLKYVDEVSIGSTWFKRLKDKQPVKEFIPRARKLKSKFKCIEVMNKLSIDWDGAVSPCCLDYDQQLSIGNIKEQTLNELWHSQAVRSIRQLLSEERQDIFKLCSTCELNYDFRGK
jgi:radical SAM protein with 4Fe4S-binding SPASM domain